MSLVLGVWLDRFDHQVECLDAVDLACHTVGPIRREAQAFGEVEQAVDALRVVVQHDKHRARSVFDPGEQKQVIGAEVEHCEGERKEREQEAPAHLGSAVVGISRRTPPAGLSSQRGA